jgi:acetyl-CoA carboxylase carboxyl transferase subunit beta
MSNWLSSFIRPKINAFGNKVKDVPDNLWEKCPACDGMLFHRDLKAAQYVCYHCDHHLRIDVIERLENLFDDGKFKEHTVQNVPVDPLKFKDKKKYIDRLTDAQKKRGRKDAIVVADGKIQGQACMIAAFDFKFQGGSMGAGVGEGIVMAAQKAVKAKIPFMVIPSSGGARMQEAAISLMQMPRTTVAVEMVKDAGLPYIVLLTDPTTGGVSASFAMLGDIQIAEPGATIGFAGKRVIQETIREELPDGFQTAEYLLEHGVVDMVVARKDQPETIGRLLDMLMNKNTAPRGKGKKTTLREPDDKLATSVPLPDVARGGNQARLKAGAK